jgi:hypothetical protein
LDERNKRILEDLFQRNQTLTEEFDELRQFVVRNRALPPNLVERSHSVINDRFRYGALLDIPTERMKSRLDMLEWITTQTDISLSQAFEDLHAATDLIESNTTLVKGTLDALTNVRNAVERVRRNEVLSDAKQAAIVAAETLRNTTDSSVSFISAFPIIGDEIAAAESSVSAAALASFSAAVLKTGHGLREISSRTRHMNNVYQALNDQFSSLHGINEYISSDMMARGMITDIRKNFLFHDRLKNVIKVPRANVSGLGVDDTVAFHYESSVHVYVKGQPSARLGLPYLTGFIISISCPLGSVSQSHEHEERVFNIQWDLSGMRLELRHNIVDYSELNGGHIEIINLSKEGKIDWKGYARVGEYAHQKSVAYLETFVHLVQYESNPESFLNKLIHFLCSGEYVSPEIFNSWNSIKTRRLLNSYYNGIVIGGKIYAGSTNIEDEIFSDYSGLTLESDATPLSVSPSTYASNMSTLRSYVPPTLGDFIEPDFSGLTEQFLGLQDSGFSHDHALDSLSRVGSGSKASDHIAHGIIDRIGSVFRF